MCHISILPDIFVSGPAALTLFSPDIRRSTVYFFFFQIDNEMVNIITVIFFFFGGGGPLAVFCSVLQFSNGSLCPWLTSRPTGR